MNKGLKWFGATLGAGAGAAAVAWHFRVGITLGLAAYALIPAIGPNHPVAWNQGPAAAAAGDRPPNVVVILADDLGYNDIRLHGGGIANGDVPTPNIDSIAQQGVELTNGYAGNATCAPSRAAIMTGRYATRFGFEFTPVPVAFARVLHWLVHNKEHPLVLNSDNIENVPPLDQQAIPTSEITVADVLHKQGYHTVHIGKWHLGGAKGSRPEDKGFDESLGFIAASSLYLPENDPRVENAKQDFDPIDRVSWAMDPYAVQFNGSPWFQPNAYMTDYLTDAAVQVIHANRNRPFLLYYAPNAVHTPLQATRADYDALSQIPDHGMRVYAAMIRNLDRNVGRVLQTLKDEGLDRNTLVVLTSDNGGAHYIGLPDINRPFRGWKATFFEGGVHVPYFMRWPDRIPAGVKYTQPVAHVDIFATAAAAAKAPVPADRVMDGVDLLPFITGQATGSPHKSLYWRSGRYRMVLADGWKYQRLDQPPMQFLYDMNADPTEQHNLAGAEPARLHALSGLMDSIDTVQAKPLWPWLVSGAIPIDHPAGVAWAPEDAYIYWDN
jgi:arylsulfatase A-like enzyme